LTLVLDQCAAGAGGAAGVVVAGAVGAAAGAVAAAGAAEPVGAAAAVGVGAAAGAALGALEATQASKSAWLTTLTSMGMKGVVNAAQLAAAAVVGADAVDLEPSVVDLPGTASVMMPNDGTAKAWITSAPVTSTSTTG
jgi:hypothetical protein